MAHIYCIIVFVVMVYVHFNKTVAYHGLFHIPFVISN